MSYRVGVFLSGVPYVRGRFDDLASAKALQAELWKQGWYYVPIYIGESWEHAQATHEAD